MSLKIKVLHISAGLTLLNGGAKCSYLSFIFFQFAKTGTDDFAGICISSSKYAGLDEFVEMGT